MGKGENPKLRVSSYFHIIVFYLCENSKARPFFSSIWKSRINKVRPYHNTAATLSIQLNSTVCSYSYQHMYDLVCLQKCTIVSNSSRRNARAHIRVARYSRTLVFQQNSVIFFRELAEILKCDRIIGIAELVKQSFCQHNCKTFIWQLC